VFLYAGSRVLDGAEEGLLGWVAVNYASGALQVRGMGVASQQGLSDVLLPNESSVSELGCLPYMG
jgi:hypothetical protein